MSFQIQCPSCGAKQKAAERSLGKKVECEHCGARFVARARQRSKKSAGGSNLGLILGIAGGVFALGGVGAVALFCFACAGLGNRLVPKPLDDEQLQILQKRLAEAQKPIPIDPEDGSEPKGTELSGARMVAPEIGNVAWRVEADPAPKGKALVNSINLVGILPDTFQIAMTPRDTPDAWFAGFAAGLARDQQAYNVTLLGGDTTSTPGPISLSLTIIGHVAPGMAVHRSGASGGDGIWVTGTIGDGALGLAVALNKLTDSTGYLLDRYRLPRPRVGLAIGGIASAGMDVSDGLVQDLGHLCRASGLGAVIEAALVPLSAPARAAGPAWLETCLTGGDDYELLLAVPPDRESALRAAAGDVPVTRIGAFHSGPPEVMVRAANGKSLALTKGGWSHF